MLKDVLKNPAFYAALIALINAIVDYFVPTFPRDIRTAVNALLAVIFGAITGTAVVVAARARSAAKAAKSKGNVIGGSKP